MEEDQYIIVDGNPVDGFGFRGVFESHDEALKYAEANYEHDTWWIATMSPPVYVEEEYDTQGIECDAIPK